MYILHILLFINSIKNIIQLINHHHKNEKEPRFNLPVISRPIPTVHWKKYCIFTKLKNNHIYIYVTIALS